MSTNATPPAENEPYNPNLDAQDEELAGGGGGGNRLALIAGGLVLLLGVGYLLVPKGQGEGLAGVTPSFMLPDAAVSGPTPAADSTARTATADTATATTTTTTAAVAAATAAKVASAAVPAAPAAAEAAPIAPEPTAPASEPAAATPSASAPAAPSSQTETVTGRITDENGQPMVAATVMLRGSSKAVSTDANGNYAIEVPAGDNKLLFGYGGYLDEVVESHGSKPVNVALTPNPSTGKKRRR